MLAFILNTVSVSHISPGRTDCVDCRRCSEFSLTHLDARCVVKPCQSASPVRHNDTVRVCVRPTVSRRHKYQHDQRTQHVLHNLWVRMPRRHHVGRTPGNEEDAYGNRLGQIAWRSLSLLRVGAMTRCSWDQFSRHIHTFNTCALLLRLLPAWCVRSGLCFMPLWGRKVIVMLIPGCSDRGKK